MVLSVEDGGGEEATDGIDKRGRQSLHLPARNLLPREERRLGERVARCGVHVDRVPIPAVTLEEVAPQGLEEDLLADEEEEGDLGSGVARGLRARLV